MSTSAQSPAFDPNVVSSYADKKWNDLDMRLKEAAAMLGYTQEAWDGGLVTNLLKDTPWDGLDAPRKDAAALLGWNDAKWNRVYSSLHS